MKPYVGRRTLPEEEFCRFSHLSYFVFVAQADSGHIKG